MKNLFVHNFYAQTGGEDVVVQDEMRLLREHGHEVFLYGRNNEEIASWNSRQKLSLLSNLSYRRDAYFALQQMIRDVRPDVVHVFNIYYLISPVVYQVCAEERVPVVQSLYNFRPVCLNGLLFRDGRVCEDCLGKSFCWPGIIHRCARGSLLTSLAVAKLLTEQFRFPDWSYRINRIIVAAEFTRQIYIAAGIPRHKISVKPHFLFPSPRAQFSGKGVLFTGRLSPEKGVMTLLKACCLMRDVPVKIVGDGPLGDEVEKFVQTNHLDNVEILGYVSGKEYHDLLQATALAVVPSECYDNFPRTIIEAFAQGKPVIASRRGSLVEAIKDGETGRLFEPGDPESLAQTVKECLQGPEQMQRMSKNAQADYHRRLSAEKNYMMLLNIYQQAIADFSAAGKISPP